MLINVVHLIYIISFLTLASAVFSIVSISTEAWIDGTGLFCSSCPKSSAGLAIISFIFFVVAIILQLTLMANIKLKIIRILALIALFLGSLFALASYASYFHSQTSYSYRLMVVSHTLSFVATILTAFWLGTFYKLLTANNN